MAKSTEKKKVSNPSKSCIYIVTGVNEGNLNSVSQTLDVHRNKMNADELLLTGNKNIGDNVLTYSNLTEKIEKSSAALIAVIPATNIGLFSALMQSIKTSTALESGNVYLPDFATEKSQKRTVLGKIGLSVIKVLGLVETDALDSGLVVLLKDDAIDHNVFINAESELENSASRFAAFCVLNGLNQHTLPLRQTKAEDIKFSFVKNLVATFSSRWNWFVTRPIKELSKFKLGNLRNGNNSLYRLLFVSLALFSLVLLPYLSFDFGITWDEPEDRKYFTEVISYFQTGGEDTRALDTNRKLHDHLVNYGPFVNLACAFAEEYISPFDTYETRHLVLSLFAFIGLLFTALLGRKAGSWRTAVIVILILLLTPAFIGHSANNQKDMPFMAFYIASLFYIVRFTKEVPNVSLKTYVMTGLTMGILFSIRAGGLIVFPYLIMFVGIKYLMEVKADKTNAFSKFFQYAFKGFIPIAIAYFIGVIFWPAAIQDPFGHPLQALKNFEKFSLVHVYEVFEGKRFYMKDYPWYYAPKMMYLTLPLFVLAGIALFLGGLNWIRSKYKIELILIIAFSVIFPLAYIIYKDSALYNSWRHVMFVLPGIIIMAAIGWDWILGLKNKIVNLVSILVLLATMGLTGSWMFKNHPYEYLYYNEIAGGVKGAYGNYELDYWCQTPKAAIKWLQENEGLDKKSAKVISNNEVYSLIYYANSNQENGKELRRLEREFEDINDDLDRLAHYKKEKIITEQEYNLEYAALTAQSKPVSDAIVKLRKMQVLWAREQQWNKDDWDYAIWTSRTLSPTQIKDKYFPPKGTIHTIDVDGVPIAAIVKRENWNIYLANEMMKRNQLDSAEVLLKEYIDYDPLEEETYRTLAYVQIVKNNWRSAINYAKRSVELCPESYFGLNFMGIAYLNMGNLDSAEYCFKKVIQYKPNYSAGHDGLGDVAMGRNNPGMAVKHYQDALSFAGNNAYIFYKKGEAHLALNELNDAANNFNASIQTNKNFSQSYMGMYKVLQKAGQEEKALEYLTQYRQMTGTQ